ncbi:Ig-like domain-containing protein [Bacillus sp. S/N-304-OC-R1]|uniref:Ig-like domain-containing protein n=1 Tax=Bacillus sp. S/N-304-OC-R1 TaxID=2758034 RepID=UPI001C8D4C16|nr:Ig-like domain-containing protein [Bacillus sp. S/N-304-OC-R1]MBY0122296.1 Ig-like domain-containing protein [Bacillus sp. S/N-304-OC-R1]
MKTVKVMGVCFILLLSIFGPAFHNSAGATTYPQIDKTIPAAGDQNVPIDSDIKIQFNSPIVSISAQYIKLYEKTNGIYYDFPIKTVRKDNQTLLIIPDGTLQFNKEYLVQINGPSIGLQNGTYSQSLSYSFQTNYIDFYELMVINERRLTNLLDNYAPRQIKAFAPDRYINEINIIHKKPGAMKDDQTSFSGITNIDITTKSNGVDTVHVDIMKNGKVLQKGYADPVPAKSKGAGQKSLMFDIGFSKVPDFYDVRVTALDSDQKILDSKILKFATENGKMINSYKEAYKYQTAGKSYTLYELLSNDKLFTTLLAESKMQDIKVQVEDR